ncbi:MAG: phosphoesterase [Parachlamydiaceae bacterium]|nr:phosphoesterase [Parachlamydiaceae bacterium]
MHKTFLLGLSLLCLAFAALQGENVVLKWNEAALTAISSASPPTAPTVGARALAIVHTSIFDAWAAYDKKAIGTGYGDLLRRPSSEFTKQNKKEAISFAAFRVLVDLFPAQETLFRNLMIDLGYDLDDLSTDVTTPVGIGNVVAANILLFRHEDGANQLADEPNSGVNPYSDYTGYQPVSPSDPNYWQPIGPQAFVTPQWGLVIPFALKSGNEFRPTLAPATYPSKRYTHQAEALIKLSANLNNLTKSIASYWADGPGTVTPPGHWNEFAHFVSHRDHHSLDDDVKLFFALDNALLDASIASWDAKRFYDYVRPISAIRFLFDGVLIEAWGGAREGTQAILGQNWQPYFSTPPFPECVSGHSTFSTASAEVLKRFTGSNHFGNSAVVPKGSLESGCSPTKNVKLFWETFSEAAAQAGISRRYGGIHFKDGDHQGRKLGRKIGERAFKKAFYYINGGDCN